jgi:hypothetical protein
MHVIDQLLINIYNTVPPEAEFFSSSHFFRCQNFLFFIRPSKQPPTEITTTFFTHQKNLIQIHQVSDISKQPILFDEAESRRVPNGKCFTISH